MSYDPLAPSPLKQLQQWFGGIISTPLQEEGRALANVPLAHYLLPNPTLSALKGMEIYQQHYWWRLFNALQTHFPALTRLLGIDRFNEEIAGPFLHSFPPTSWSLKSIGDGLPNWIKQSDRADRKLILQVAEIDLAYLKGGAAEQLAPFSPTRTEDDFHLPLKLQPHLTLFELSGILRGGEFLHFSNAPNPRGSTIETDPILENMGSVSIVEPRGFGAAGKAQKLTSPQYNLFQWRSKLLQKDVAYWSKYPPPKLTLKKESVFFILYRTLDNCMHYEELSKYAFQLLEQFQAGKTLESLCEKLESDDEAEAENFDRWLGEWIKKGWLAKIQEKLPT